jgi:hypothetical protein
MLYQKNIEAICSSEAEELIPRVLAQLAGKGLRFSAMQDKRDLELAKLEDDLSILEQHAKHVVSLLGRRLADLGERVAALEESSRLFQEIRQIKDKVHALQGKP